MKCNKLKNKASMRWHPSIIRWCLFLRSKSAKAYDGMRAYLPLPSNRTLFDYTHYIDHGTGTCGHPIKSSQHSAIGTESNVAQQLIMFSAALMEWKSA
jgi:hypothetical protein